MALKLPVDQVAVGERIGVQSSHPMLVILFIPTKDQGGKELKDAEMWLKAGILHRMGRSTNQGEIGVVVDGTFHRITKYRKVEND